MLVNYCGEQLRNLPVRTGHSDAKRKFVFRAIATMQEILHFTVVADFGRGEVRSSLLDGASPASLAREARATHGLGLLSLVAGLSMATLSPAAALDLRGFPFVAQFSLPDTPARNAPYTNSTG